MITSQQSIFIASKIEIIMCRIEHRVLEAYRGRVSTLAQKMKPISLPAYCAKPPPGYRDHRSAAGATAGASAPPAQQVSEAPSRCVDAADSH